MSSTLAASLAGQFLPGAGGSKKERRHVLTGSCVMKMLFVEMTSKWNGLSVWAAHFFWPIVIFSEIKSPQVGILEVRKEGNKLLQRPALLRSNLRDLSVETGM